MSGAARLAAGITLFLLPAYAAAAETFTFGAAGKVAVYAPAGTPQQVVLFVSGDGGWNQGVVPMAERLQRLGALVVGIDIRSYLRHVESSAQACAYPAGDLEQLSHAVQLHRHLAEYRTPILVGYSSGATLVYAALAAAPAGTFAGALSLGFCPDLEQHKPPCFQRELRGRRKAKGVGYDLEPAGGLAAPWMVLQGEIDQVCGPAATRRFVSQVPRGELFALPKVGHGFSVPRNWDAAYVDAYRRLAAAPATPVPAVPGVQDLPLVELPASDATENDRLAVVFSGDGGWTDIDAGIAQGLVAAGIPAVGWSSLRYFWTPRTPEAAARDLGRVLDHYLAAWGKSRAVLVGYSFGADALPFLVHRLPPELRTRVDGVVLIGLSRSAQFEFKLADWLTERTSTYPTLPEVERLDARVACVYGADERDAACAAAHGARVRPIRLAGGHHLGGDYAGLAATLVEWIEERP
ncbi:MAG TPA: AcvB/VirJ family lysyl-phosphatidylglycerol hydrolase [Candidatus Polarisedimenticolaceae bacterium]|nr:AcvB/VirJ family lysyl-phosphatidylglycerol hydrolase [Candidatus Polarisedimenticolaceae bacterium]